MASRRRPDKHPANRAKEPVIDFRCIVADPPWPERGSGKSKRGADRHYRLLEYKEIPDVMKNSPVWRPDPVGCHLWLWSTTNSLPKALWLMEILGFRYLTNAVWSKEGGRPGLGRYMRHRHELLLLGRMGETMMPSTDCKPKTTVISAPRRGHSEKPDKAYEYIEMVSPGPRLEMFARRKRKGWVCWGDELDLRSESGD